MYNIVTVTFKDSNTATANGVRQWDYGQILRIQGLQLPTAVEVHFALIDSKDSVTRIGTTKDGVTDVVIPDSMIEAGKNIFAYVYLRDSESGQTEYEIKIVVTTRAKPEAFDTPEDNELFAQAIEAVNEAADRAEKSGQTATEAAGQAAEDAQQTAEDRKEVAKMVETVSDISEQVKKVEELSNKAQESATQAGASAVAAEKAKAQVETAVGKTAEDRIAVNQAKITVDEVQKAVRADRAAVEEVKQSVEQLSNAIPESTQAGVQAVNQAKQTAVDEIARTGVSHKTAVEAAGTQAVESVENVQQVATEAVETAKTEAVQAVQAEGVKQIKEVQDKGAEVLQSIPEDFATQMETKLNKRQGIENKGKVLVIGEDGNVVPGEVSSGGGDGIAIINTMSGESPLVIPDSAERVNKGLELGGKTEQVQTTGKNLLDEKLLKTLSNYTSNGSDYYYYRISGLEVGKKYTVSRGDVKTGKGALLGISVNQESTNKAKFLVHDGLGTSYNNASITWEQTTGEYVDILFSVSGSVTSTTQERLSEFWGRISYVQLEKGTTATPYEPYTGGKPSPSQEYPQEIKNSGKWNEGTQKYEIEVVLSGKNLLDITACEDGKALDSYGNIINSANGFLTDFIPCFANSPYCRSNKSFTIISFYDRDKNFIGCINQYNDEFITPDECRYFRFSINKQDVDYTKAVANVGTALMDYEPYKKPQTLTLTSDRPITKWDKLVEQGGQIGWLYKHKIIEDFSTLVKDTEPIYGNNGGKFFSVSLQNASLNYDRGKIYSEVGTVGKDSEIYYIPKQLVATTIIYVSDTDTIMTAKEHMHYKVVYETVDSEFIPLPQSEQNAIRALKAYYPTTVITVDGGELYPDIKITYTADTKNYIDGKVSAKVASILRQYQADTANLLSLMPMETQATMIENDTNNILNNLESEETHE